MKTLKSFLTLTGCLAYSFMFGQSTIPSAEVQMKTALLAAPEQKRADATIYGYNEKGGFITLKAGTNDYICITDDPNGKGFSVSSYHVDLEPFMARGRALKVEGKSFEEIFSIREEEVKSGNLKMPKDGTTLFVYFASDENYNRETGEITNGNFRYVVYIPWATAETTGLPLKPEAPGMPWIMDPGTHRAHIMINPPVKK